MSTHLPHDGIPGLSIHGISLLEIGVKFFQYHLYIRDSYHSESNPNGFIDLGIAENSLMHEELSEYFMQKFHLLPEDYTYGDGVSGRARLCNAMAYFLNTYFNPHRPISPDHLVMGAGLTPILSQLSRMIANPGEGILLAAPYYQGFDGAFLTENGIIPVGAQIPTSDMFTLAEINHLERALEKSEANGTKIKALILCNPQNPLGRSYPRDVVTAYCKLCETHDLYLISDEVYAHSTFSSSDVPDPDPFVSALSLNIEEYGVNPARIIVLYGMSKDFNANGFRAGVLVAQSNEMILNSVTVSAINMLVSSPTDILWSSLLTDESYLPGFIEENRRRLREAYEYIISWLNLHKVSYMRASAGYFVMINVRAILERPDVYAPGLNFPPEASLQEREKTFSDLLLSHKVILASGRAFHMSEDGWFRFTFSIRRDWMDVALRRLEVLFGWDSGMESGPPLKV